MDRKGGCRIARYATGTYDMSKVDRIILRYRPIAPKPITGNSGRGGFSPESSDSSMQRWRATMEDAHAAYLDLDAFISSFGVYDGHGGKVVAKFCAKYLHQQVLKNDTYAAEDIATPDCLILAISPANQDLATSDAIKWILLGRGHAR